MVKKIDFALLEEAAGGDPKLAEARNRRWSRREANPTVQMSVRMAESDYERFRALCAHERRTNGEMMVELLNNYIQNGASK
tara:strand:+ start:16376 stop:16618 length:243 start_codon:yes stop_codon:yes gene_type:complete